jgi:hypothetical protein
MLSAAFCFELCIRLGLCGAGALAREGNRGRLPNDGHPESFSVA